MINTEVDKLWMISLNALLILIKSISFTDRITKGKPWETKRENVQINESAT